MYILFVKIKVLLSLSSKFFKDTHQSLDHFCLRLYFHLACPAAEAAPEDPEEALRPL